MNHRYTINMGSDNNSEYFYFDSIFLLLLFLFFRRRSRNGRGFLHLPLVQYVLSSHSYAHEGREVREELGENDMYEGS